jgi:hypothetical protein
MIEDLIYEMICINGKDTRRINHALKVYALADCIAGRERVPGNMRHTIAAAAILHDIAIRFCEDAYGVCGGKLQEKEGPAIARPILERCGVDADTLDRVLYLIAHHHTYKDVDGLDYQIIIEADFLVNRDEGDFSHDAFVGFFRKYFKTQTGKELAHVMFGVA